MLYLAMFAAYFVYVFFKALQQRNVVFDNFLYIIPISWIMAACEVFVIGSVASVVIRDNATIMSYIYATASMGTGGGTGAIIAMLFHGRFIK